MLSFPYSIENPNGSSLSAGTTAVWIKDIVVKEKEISLSVSENNDGRDREASISLSYDGALPVMVNIRQEWSSAIVRLSKTSESFDYQGGAGSFSFEIQNPRQGATVSAGSKCDWISDVSVNGTAVTYKVRENNSGAPRTGEIVLEYGKHASAVFSVEQKWTESLVILTPSQQEIGYMGGEASFEYRIDNPRESANVSAVSNNDWITGVSLNGKTVTYTVLENTVGSQRTGSISLKYGDYATADFVIRQAWTASTIDLTPSLAEPGYEGGNGSFSFQLNNPHQGATMSATSDSDWIKDVVLDGTSVSYSVMENNSGSERSGRITLSYGQYATAVFTINQKWAAATISLSHSSGEIGYQGGEHTFSYSVNNPRQGTVVSITSSYGWISQIQSEASAVVLTVSESASGLSRSGQIVLSYGNFDMATYTIRQLGKPAYSMTLDKETLSLVMNATYQLKASVSPWDSELEWVSSVPAVVSVSQDGTLNAKGKGEALITVKSKAGGVTATCKVTVSQQSGDTEGMGEEIWK